MLVVDVKLAWRADMNKGLTGEIRATLIPCHTGLAHTPGHIKALHKQDTGVLIVTVTATL
jgi:hypothetical protein